MNIGAILIVLSTVIYAAASLAFFCAGDRPLGITYAGYTLANLGVIWLAFRDLP